MIRVAFKTLGCRANQYDTEVMKESLRREGYLIVEPEEAADVYIVNTCTVTARAEAKARQFIHGFARRGGLVLATGCWATLAPEEVEASGGVALVFGNGAKLQVARWVEAALAGERGVINIESSPSRIDEERISSDSCHSRAFVKIQDGCDRGCTFCRTRLARGRSRSKPPELVVAEVEGLVRNGFREVVLTGINLADYGNGGEALAELLWRLAEIPGLERIRLSSINQEGITPALVRFFRECEKGCPYFHIPLQSGDDLLLERMNRGYTAAEYREKIELIRGEVPRATFGADVLVGFPGETEEQFERTCRLVEEVGFLRLHIFRYSPRPGTLAARLPDQVPEQVKRERARRLQELGRRVSRRVKESFIWQRLRVLVEEPAPDGRYRGWSENYIEVHLGLSELGGGEPQVRVQPGQIIEVEVQELCEDGDYLLGVPIAITSRGIGGELAGVSGSGARSQ